ncbi:MAG: monovalent cation/H+ antiporter complex subunit F [Kiritimatiellales bacterium]
MEQAKQFILIAGSIVLAVMILLTLVRAIIGPRFTDRMIAVNVINTIVVAIICMLSVWLEENFLVDVALIYALLSFLTVVVLSRLVLLRQRRKLENEKRQKKGGSQLAP